MGYGSYTSADWSRLKASSKISAESTASQMFKNQTLLEKFNPLYIDKRLAMDSEEHPNSTPIIIGLDVTGSMGYLSAEIAKNGLHETMMKIYSTKPVEDPQLMFAAIGDVTDKAPLQVTQFESDIRIAEQLLDLWLEGCGGDGPEDFELLWYFAAMHTKIDSFDKHGKKGFLFTIGDADLHNEVSSECFKAIFGDNCKSMSSDKLFKMASEKYNVFHISLSKDLRCFIPSGFARILPGKVAVLPASMVSSLPELIISIMQLENGMKPDDVFKQWSETTAPVLKKAVSGMYFGTNHGISF